MVMLKDVLVMVNEIWEEEDVFICGFYMFFLFSFDYLEVFFDFKVNMYKLCNYTYKLC